LQLFLDFSVNTEHRNLYIQMTQSYSYQYQE
jgi:hypothetical protein